MRVAIVSQVTARQRETELTRRTQRTARLLAEHGHEVTVFCSQWWEGDLHSFEQEEVDYEALAPNATESPSSQFAMRLPFALRRVDPDIIHATYPPGRHVMGAQLGSTLSRAPLVVDWYGDGPMPFADYEATPVGRMWAARCPAAVITPSQIVRTSVREAGADDDTVYVIPNSIDVEQIKQIEPENVADIVYSRPLDEDANVESLLLALAEYRDRDWTAAVIGDGPERAGYERQARDLRIEDRVTFVGDQPVEKRIAAFKGAHVYVQTARRESFPTDLLRALACGCVGVVEYHARSSAHELVENEERGFRATNEKELTEALRAAGDLSPMSFNEEFAAYDNGAVLDQYLDCYERARESFGLL